MGWFAAVACLAVGCVAGNRLSIAVRTEADMNNILHHVANGGCIKEFTKAVGECHPDLMDPAKRADNAEACVKATAALRKCFAGNPEWFRHVYLRRIDEGLDQDGVPPTPREMYPWTFRWWAGMRRS